jgi:hypothetical protein
MHLSTLSVPILVKGSFTKKKYIMKTQSNTTCMFGLIIIVMLFVASRPSQETFDKITVREFELVDENGTKRVTIQAYPEGEVVFRLRDENGNVRVKLGAAADGSGFVLLDDNDSGIQALAKKNGISISQFDREGKKRVY